MSKFSDFMMSPDGGLTAMGVGAGLQGVGALFSYFNQRDAQKQLDSLNKQPLPRYSVNPAVSRIYGGAVRGVAQPQGFTGGQRAMYNQDIAQGINTQYNNARSMGGGSLSRAISGSLAGNRLNAYNQMAGQDAQLARQYQNAAYSRMLGAANTMQGVQNQNTNLDVNRRLRQEELLGQAITSNRDYRRNMLNQFGSELGTFGMYNAMGSGGGDEGTGRYKLGMFGSGADNDGILPATREGIGRIRGFKR
jgi:hypothetical protein